MAAKLDAENFQILDKHSYIWNQFQKDGTIKSLSHEVKKELESVHIFLFNKTVNLYCPQCIVDMIRALFRAYGDYEKPVPEKKKKRKRINQAV